MYEYLKAVIYIKISTKLKIKAVKNLIKNKNRADVLIDRHGKTKPKDQLTEMNKTRTLLNNKIEGIKNQTLIPRVLYKVLYSNNLFKQDKWVFN